MTRKLSNDGFSAVEAAVVLFVVAALGLGGFFVWRHNHNKHETASQTTSKSTGSSSTQKQTSQQKQQTADPYAGWQTACDDAAKACYRYPSDWVVSPYNGYQNSADTAYVQLQGHNNKDQSVDEVYIASIDDFNTSGLDLKIVGIVATDNHAPGYVVYDSSYVEQQGLAVGQTRQLIVGNATFHDKGSTETSSFGASPGANGYAAITNMDQAKAWFGTAEAKTCLKVLQSFYYQ